VKEGILIDALLTRPLCLRCRPGRRPSRSGIWPSMRTSVTKACAKQCT